MVLVAFNREPPPCVQLPTVIIVPRIGIAGAGDLNFSLPTNIHLGDFGLGAKRVDIPSHTEPGPKEIEIRRWEGARPQCRAMPADHR
jgi:hypothetical protein